MKSLMYEWKLYIFCMYICKIIYNLYVQWVCVCVCYFFGCVNFCYIRFLCFWVYIITRIRRLVHMLVHMYIRLLTRSFLSYSSIYFEASLVWKIIWFAVFLNIIPFVCVASSYFGHTYFLPLLRSKWLIRMSSNVTCFNWENIY